MVWYDRDSNSWVPDGEEPTPEPKGNCQQKCCAGTTGTVTHRQEMSGDSWTCSACGHKEYYSIGD